MGEAKVMIVVVICLASILACKQELKPRTLKCLLCGALVIALICTLQKLVKEQLKR